MALLVFVVLLLVGGWLWYGLLPLRWQNSRLAGPDAALQRACRAASRGRWEPAAELFADAGQDWERRALYAQRLGHLAAWRSDGWLKAWQEARPEGRDVALVVARARVVYAWKLRGHARAVQTSRKQFEGFHRELRTSRGDLARAAALHPDDPSPFIAEIWTALGLGYPNREMHALWAEITVRAPHHFEAHTSALQYWTAKWQGSNKLAREFAEKAAAGAPPGSLLSVLPLLAWYEAEGYELGEPGFRSARIRALTDAALADVALADAHHPRLPEVRHVLAYFLYMQGRYRAAREQFRKVDGYTEALPWRYHRVKQFAYRVARNRTAHGALTERRVR
ncbi:hypothetical protein [Streptomyces sp. NPDC058657]|uniref:hypothetical protein n=1 Tax=unclassified Streptomyces TaxID=2593676 RepID=UPI00366173C2